jgi:hypothetical protein
MIRRPAAAACLLALALAPAFAGCGGATELPTTKLGAFNMVEGSISDIISTIESPTYKPRSNDLGTDSDRIGLALDTLIKESTGTPVEAEVKTLQTKFQALEKLTASRAAVDKQREAAREVKAAVDAVKSKL